MRALSKELNNIAKTSKKGNGEFYLHGGLGDLGKRYQRVSLRKTLIYGSAKPTHQNHEAPQAKR